MTQLLTAAQMRRLEQAAIESGQTTGLELMERAGQGVVDAIFREWPTLSQTAHRAVILCGPGNNGGDGFVIARLLRDWGWEVEVYLYGNAQRLPPDARQNHDIWCAQGPVAPLEPGVLSAAIARAETAAEFRWSDELQRDVARGQTTVFVDALFGTGLRRRFDDELLEIISEWTEMCYEHSVAVDIPSGLCADTGHPIGGASLACHLVVTFESPKLGHYLGDSSYDVRRLICVDLGLDWPAEILMNSIALMQRDHLELDAEGWSGTGLQKSAGHHKFSHGHALVLTGGSGRTGAARLAGRAALRVGAGLVTLGVPGAAQMEVACHITALMLTRVGSSEELTQALQDPRITALCLGPGLGLERARALVRVACEDGRRMVLDADALSAFTDAPGDLFALLHPDCVLTPHAGEFTRLFPDLAEGLSLGEDGAPGLSKVEATRAAARRAGCVVLFKGADTVMAAPDGRTTLHAAQYERRAPWLATAGAGDVLAGYITGLLARGFDPMQAAEIAAWLHVECALAFGPGLIAEDLPDVLPSVLRDLGL